MNEYMPWVILAALLVWVGAPLVRRAFLRWRSQRDQQPSRQPTLLQPPPHEARPGQVAPEAPNSALEDTVADIRLVDSAEAWGHQPKGRTTDEAAQAQARLQAEQARQAAARAAEEQARQQAAQREAERIEAKRLEAARLQAEQAEQARQAEVRAAEAQARQQAAQREAERIEAERLEAARLQAEQAEQARQAKARAAEEQARQQAAQREAERIEAERLEAARLQAEQAEQARQAKARAAEEQARQQATQREAERIEAEQARLAAAAAEKARRDEAEQRACEQARQVAEEAARLQAQAQAEAQRTEVATPPAAAKSRTPAETLVLVADDSKVVRVKTSRLLIKHGYQVALAEDGTEAARLLGESPPHVLITDVEMPGMDGFELSRHVRDMPRMAHIPIIMVTAAEEKHAPQAALVGVSVLLGKPYRDEDLIAHVASSLTLDIETGAELAVR